MPQACKICKHSDRQAIDRALLDGWPALRVLGAQYSVSKDSLSRHWRAHVDAGDDQADNEPTTTLNNQPKSNGGTEARQTVLKQGKTDESADGSTVTNSEDLRDAEARYTAFIERWRDRQGVWRYELEGEEELIETAVNRDHLFAFGAIYVRTAQAASRLAEKC